MTFFRPNQSFPLPALIAVCAVTVGSIFILSTVDAKIFFPYFGPVQPVLAAVLVCLAGTAALARLHSRWSFSIYDHGAGNRRFLLAVLSAVPLMISVTLADVLLRFPQNINVSAPLALIFYPVMGYIAQIALHIVPLVLLLSIIERLFPSWSIDRRVWTCIALVTILEACFQALGPGVGAELSALSLFVVAHVFVFGLVELYLFRRFDFVTMYLFRVSYYGYWHIAWGYFRLRWLY